MNFNNKNAVPLGIINHRQLKNQSKVKTFQCLAVVFKTIILRLIIKMSIEKK